MTRIAINGLGRIGQTFMKLGLENPALEIVAANDIADPDTLAPLIKYDSVYGKYHGSVYVERVSGEVWLQIGTRRLRLSLSAVRRPFPGRHLTFTSLSKLAALSRHMPTPAGTLMPAPHTLCSRRRRRTRMPMTERPIQNEYWEDKETG